MASVGAGTGIAFLMSIIPGGRTIFWLLPPIAVAFIAVICFRDLARRDRTAFLSIMVPAFAVAVLAAISPPRLGAFLALLSILFIGLFVFTEAMGRWWWHYVLRRRPPSAAETFDYRLGWLGRGVAARQCRRRGRGHERSRVARCPRADPRADATRRRMGCGA
ncbi:MAG TPA: hypothetical protein VFY18_06635 [Candidatus Limnocylindrales bacterium]|nr:hypothetical protein [Candidatus Limnocylindrales bacterium]